MQLCQDEARVWFTASAKETAQTSLCCSRLKVCALGGVGTLLSLEGQQVSEGLHWFFRLEKPVLRFHGLLYERRMLGFCNQSQSGKGFSDSWQSQKLQWWILCFRNESSAMRISHPPYSPPSPNVILGKALVSAECWSRVRNGFVRSVCKSDVLSPQELRNLFNYCYFF